MRKSKNNATVRDIAELAKVSTATVSRALNQNGIVKAETYQAIIDAANTLGYTLPPMKPQPAVNNTQSFHKTESKNLVLVNIPSMSNPFYSEIIKGIQSSVVNNNYEFLMYSGDIKDSTIDHFLSFINTLHISGIISLNLIGESLLEKLTEFVPVVQCCEYSVNPYASSVGISDYSATQCALEYFLSMGKKKIAFINGPLNFKYSQNRLEAFTTIMKENNITIPPHWIIQLPDLNPDMAFSSVVKLLSLPDAPDCFFAVSDILAAAAIRAAQYCNLKVPEDVLVIGFDNTIISQLTSPSITTINQPKFQLGFLAGELLFEKVQNPMSEVKHMKLSTELIIRESTASTF